MRKASRPNQTVNWTIYDFDLEQHNECLLQVEFPRDTALADGDKFKDFARVLWTDTDVNRAFVSIEIKPIKCTVRRNPSGDLAHVLVLDEEVRGSAQSLANRLSVTPDLTRRMLI